MKYQSPAFDIEKPSDRLGLLLVNLGTPDAPDTGAVRRYLAEFLHDPRVVELTRWIWCPVLHGIILRIRPKRSAAAYQKVWGDNGSPLMDISLRQQQALQQLLDQRLDGRVRVELAMRYGQPSIADGLSALQAQGIGRVLVLPLYPQYSATTSATVFDAVSQTLRRWRLIPELRTINDYYRQGGYIRALADSVRDFQREHGQPQKLLLSFHGIPQDYADAGDPYPLHCRQTGELLAAELGLVPEQWALSFQSRLGTKPWLQPYTDQTLQQWGREGVKSVQVLCPGFSADCLETLEEIAMENRDTFRQAGGGDYHYIPALNDRPDHIAALADLAEQHLAGWL